MIAGALRVRVSKLVSGRIPWLCSTFRSIDIVTDGAKLTSAASDNGLSRTTTEPAVADNHAVDAEYKYNTTNPPDPIPNRPLRTEKPDHGFRSSSSFDNFDDEQENMKKKKKKTQYSPLPKLEGHGFLDKFKLGFDKGGGGGGRGVDKHLPEAEAEAEEEKPQDADDIFKKMKETGLIPNAVAMLDGLCKDGLVQEAMKLFGLMREKGTIPEVVIYTAVVEGFCKAQKLDDALRIFRKMHDNGISPNAFSYAVLIQGLYKGKRLEDALDLSMEMLEAGHSLNLATFAGLVDGFCRQKGLEEARTTIGALRQKGFSFDEKLVREYLDKKGPFLPLVWEAIFGKKSSQGSF